jgi:acetyl esterase/lipase
VLWSRSEIVVQVRREELTGPSGVRFVPEEHSGVGVLVLAGSRGSADEPRARLFAESGAIAESIQWFGGVGQHSGPWEVPIEMFQDRVGKLSTLCDRVILVGLSFGAEAALVTATRTPQVTAVVALSPTDVVWAGVTAEGRQTSHWTIDGVPVPFVPFAEDWEPRTEPPIYRDLYLYSRRINPTAVDAAAIPVERIPTLIQVVGGQDLVWPSDRHAEAIEQRRSHHGLTTTTVVDEDAGHRAVLPGEPVVDTGQRMQRGGDATANRRLGQAAWVEIQALLGDR